MYKTYVGTREKRSLPEMNTIVIIIARLLTLYLILNRLIRVVISNVELKASCIRFGLSKNLLYTFDLLESANFR